MIRMIFKYHIVWYHWMFCLLEPVSEFKLKKHIEQLESLAICKIWYNSYVCWFKKKHENITGWKLSFWELKL